MCSALSPSFPSLWSWEADYQPENALQVMQGKDYLALQQRLRWFLRDQRHLIAVRRATTSYYIRTEPVEIDRERGWAHFKTSIRDVLGNEATMYGSESSRTFRDYIERASNKSLGRTLALLGYGTPFAQEIGVHTTPDPSVAPAGEPELVPMASDRQISSIQKLCANLGYAEPNLRELSFESARALLQQLNKAMRERGQQ